MALDGKLRVECPNCLAENGLREKFCQHCGTQLSDLAVTDPTASASADSNIVPNAMDCPTRPIVLTGVWLLFGPIFFTCLVIFIGSIAGCFTSPFGPVTAGTILAVFLLFLTILGVGAVSGTILWRTSRAYGRSPRHGGGRQDPRRTNYVSE